MRRKDWTLLAIYAADGKGLSPVQLQKTLFLLGRELPEAVGHGYYDFRPYHYGPFDRTVYSDAEVLAESGHVAITQRDRESWSRYLATAKGCEIAEAIKKEASAAAVAYLQRVVDWALRQSFQQLVRSIYARYPEMRANSVFQG